MLSFLLEHSGMVILITLAAAVLYFVIQVASRAEQTGDKRAELMKRVQRLKEKLDIENKA